jgi:hypothetical protein
MRDVLVNSPTPWWQPLLARFRVEPTAATMPEQYGGPRRSRQLAWWRMNATADRACCYTRMTSTHPQLFADKTSTTDVGATHPAGVEQPTENKLRLRLCGKQRPLTDQAR